MFLARLEYEEKHDGKDFNVDIVRSFLPKNVPVLRDLYEIILRVSQEITPIDQAIGLLVDQLNAADIERIRHKLTDHKAGEDPVIQFYEPFLSAYDPVERESRGVYYTPKPLVDYIVRGVDYILRTRFDKNLGVADKTVQILDPATGSGTFLMSAIQQTHYNIKLEYGGLGEEELERRFQDIVLQHILKHFYGFELLMAPYAVAHLKLTLELERMGFDWSKTVNDGDEDNNRLKVYLANSLDDPNQPPKFDLPGFHLAEESNKAMEVKKNAPVIAVIGNPPYSGISMNPHELVITDKNGKRKKTRTFIGSLIEDYKFVDGVHFGEKKHWLQDDYVKFIRLSEYLIFKHGEGVIGFVTNHSYLDNPTFRGMRNHLINTFDEIYIVDLHGNSIKKETAPDGSKDENIFGIRQGVAIIFAIKFNSKETNKKGAVLSSDVWGTRRYKEEWLLNNDIEKTKFTEIPTNTKDLIFKYKDQGLADEFANDLSLVDLFSLSTSGIQTSRDDLVIDFSRVNLMNRISDFVASSNTDDMVRNKYFGDRKSNKFPRGDTRGWKICSVRPLLRETNLDLMIQPYSYRPFDNRYLAYSTLLIDWPRKEVMDNLVSHDNLSLTIGRQGQVTGSGQWNLAFIQRYISDLNLFYRGGGIVCPLYTYPQQMTLDGSNRRHHNLNTRIIENISSTLNLKWVNDHEQKNLDDNTKFSPLDIYDYVYAVLNSPKYREKYKDFLKSDFPRVPFPIKNTTFWKLVSLGRQLRQLHLMGDDPFGSPPEILRDSTKWLIQPKGQRDGLLDWKIEHVTYEESIKRVYVNDKQYFEGIESRVWNFYIGGYQILDKWLKDRKKANKNLSTDDRLQFVKIAVVLRETIRIQKEIDAIGFLNNIGSEEL